MANPNGITDMIWLGRLINNLRRVTTVKILYFVCLIVVSFAVWAKETTQPWNWYYVGISSREPETKLITRTGISEVVIADKNMRISFGEKNMPELKATYVGTMDATNKVVGELNGFFFDGPEKWQGHYTETKIPGCLLQELILTSGVANGDVLVLSRMHGTCQ